MRIYLLHDPWAAQAAHEINADDPTALRIRLAEIWLATRARRRFSVAAHCHGTDRPHVLQALASRHECTPAVVTPDGFVVARPEHHDVPSYAERLWAAILDGVEFVAQSERFLGGPVADLTRRAVYPAPRIVENDE